MNIPDSLTLPRRAYTVCISRRPIEGAAGEDLQTRTTSSQTGDSVAVGHPQRIHLVKSSFGAIITLYGLTIVVADVPLRVIWQRLCLSVSINDAPKYQAKVYPRADALNGITSCLNNKIPYCIKQRSLIVRFPRHNQPFVVTLGLAIIGVQTFP